MTVWAVQVYSHQLDGSYTKGLHATKELAEAWCNEHGTVWTDEGEEPMWEDATGDEYYSIKTFVVNGTEA
jgi:hypothetical protein